MDYYYPEDEKEFVCNVCETPIDEPGVCSYKCFQVEIDF